MSRLVDLVHSKICTRGATPQRASFVVADTFLITYFMGTIAAALQPRFGWSGVVSEWCRAPREVVFKALAPL
jgi:hypothetical protein